MPGTPSGLELKMVKGFVPTMGALHAGHASLITAAAKACDEVVVSIFVNPLQFNDKVDLAKYPRTPEHDKELALNAGATKVWFPTYEEIYPGDIKLIEPGPIGELYEGASRPGHFAGMLTVVRRLFDLVKPDKAFFGEKDFQQLFLIKQMAKDIEIIGLPTVREADGLAMSSRNVRLSPEDRQAALVIYRALKSGNLDLSSEPRFKTDYAVVIDEDTFQIAQPETKHKRALIAGTIGGVRLIDNMVIA